MFIVVFISSSVLRQVLLELVEPFDQP